MFKLKFIILFTAMGSVSLGCGTEDTQEVHAPTTVKATLARTLSEDETSGPLFNPRSLMATDTALYVLDSGNHRVVVLPRAGAPRVIGRQGAGPGEFIAPTQLLLGEDGRISIWDRSARRITNFSASGTLTMEPMDVRVPGLQPRSLFPLRNGYAVILDKSLRTMDFAPRGVDLKGVLVRVTDPHVTGDTLAHFPLSGPPVIRQKIASGATMTTFMWPFDAPPYSSSSPACGGIFAVSVGGREFEVALFDRNARKLTTLRTPDLGEMITADQRDDYFDQIDPATVRHFNLRSVVEIPERHAAVQALRVTSTGHLLVRHTHEASAADVAVWSLWPIHMGEGAVRLGDRMQLLLPHRFHAHDIRRDTVWGFYSDELDVPTVQAYKVPRAISPGCERPRSSQI